MNVMTRPLTLLLWLALSLIALPSQAQEDELLPPEQAFSLSARMDGDRIVATYRIAPGYYMYRKQFAFESETDGVQLAEPEIPPGHKKKDEFFGEVETYRDAVEITVPVRYNGQPPARLRIKARGQGCADLGVCYPPLFQTLNLTPGSNATVMAEPYQRPQDIRTLAGADKPAGADSGDPLQALLSLPVASDTPAKAATQSEPPKQKPDASSDALSLLQSFGDDIGLDDEEEIPSPDQAYRISAALADDNTLTADIIIRDKTYLYKDKFGAQLAAGSGVSVGQPSLPKGDIKNDEFFGRMEVYHNAVQFPIPLKRSPNASPEFAVALNYQGCVEDKICYPPMTKYLKVNLDKGTVDILDDKPEIADSVGADDAGGGTPATADASETDTTAAGEGASTATLGQSEQDRFNSILSQGSLWLIVFSFFVAGILLTFTPCVFPMIPILSGIIAGQGERITTRKAFVLSLVYVLAMAVTYAIAGAIVGYFGAEFNIQAWFQDPLILSLFAALFVLLALSMFGFYELQMPSFIQSRVTEISNRQQGGELVGVGIMGSLSALIVGPCITAPLVGALIFISQTQDWLTGGLALFALGLGMGVPLMVVGTAGGKFLPKAGSWMDAVKAVFGVGLLAIAIWMLERILPTEVTMLLMAALIIVSAIYMGAIDSLPEGASGWRKLWKGLGFILLLYGAFYLYGVAAGSKDLIQPLKGLNKGTTVIQPVPGGTASAAQPRADHIVFQRIKGIDGLEKALATARANKQPVMLDFYADWCISCKEIEKYAFTHPRVLQALDGFMTIQADVTPNDKTDKALMKSLGIFGPPAILFFDRNGKEIPGSRVVGAMGGEEFAAHIIKWTQDI